VEYVRDGDEDGRVNRTRRRREAKRSERKVMMRGGDMTEDVGIFVDDGEVAMTGGVMRDRVW
jgi:hypothetical protein